MGVRVRTAPVPPRWWGAYDHARRLITLRPGLSPIQKTCTLMHELGHAHYGHQGITPKQELLANRWAAYRLIQYDDLRALAGSGMPLPEVAAHLGVMPEVLRVYLTTLNFAELEGLKRSA
ncbi:ImmA/IrrE family metallo-endopeptidase [Arthrobacter woluwensis]|nr:ImmA/IrrE family metallo-endopeptidase [Arthrobacter woluwensis]